MKAPLSRWLAVQLLLTTAALAADWPAWRGPDSSARLTDNESKFPVTWTEADVTWKIPLPDRGNSSPVVVGDRVFLTQSTDKGAQRSLMCLDRKTGKLLWQKDVAYPKQEPTHGTNPHCSSTPVSDGKVVYVWHGSAGFFAYDMSGKELWKRDFGEFVHIWGNAASPILFQDTVIQHLGPGLTCSLVAMNRQTGKTVWQTDLPTAQSEKVEQFKGSWATPLMIQVGNATQLVLPLPKRLTGFDPTTGKEIWYCEGLSDLCYTDTLAAKDVLVAMCGYGGPAIGMKFPKAGDKGNLTATHQLWVTPRNQQRIGSGIAIGDHVFICNEPGAGLCIEAATGKVVWQERIGRNSWSSMCLVNGKLYIPDQSGAIHVLEPDAAAFKLIASNKVTPGNEHSNSTPAFANGQIFHRTWQNLYCIGKEN